MLLAKPVFFTLHLLRTIQTPSEALEKKINIPKETKTKNLYKNIKGKKYGLEGKIHCVSVNK